MFTLLSRKLTCLAWVAGLAFVGTMLLAPAASAEGGSMYGTHTFGQVAAACGSAGGTFNVRPDGGYGCKTVNKDGSTKGVIYCDGDGSCSYSCSNCPAVGQGRPPWRPATAGFRRRHAQQTIASRLKQQGQVGGRIQPLSSKEVRGPRESCSLK
jgi:hypothetical protein